MDPATLIGAGGSVVSGILNLIAQGQAGGRQQQALDMQLENMIAQRALAQRQYELATSGREDARGNQVTYIPGRGWVTNLSPDSGSAVRMSDAAERQAMIRALTTGQADSGRNFRRRLDEGREADELLGGFQFDMPTRAGVRGNRTISNVTQATEGADLARNAVTGTALRTGASSGPTSQNLSVLNRGAASGLRSALARSGDESEGLFQTMLQQAQKSKLDPYNMLATRASNSSDIAFKPESITGPSDTALGTAAGVGAMRGAYAPGLAQGFAGVADALGRQTTPSYDMFAGGITEQLKKIFASMGGNSSVVPTYEDRHYSGRTSSGNTYG